MNDDLESRSAGFVLLHRHRRALHVSWQDHALLSYVYRPQDAQLESPRPYFHPLRTLAGDVVTLNRPWDHRWHKGVAWSLANVGSENFWGGDTYGNGEYKQLANDGTQRHDAFELLCAAEDHVRWDERLTWITQAGETWFRETRRIGVVVLEDAATWAFTFESELHNVTENAISIGSPATRGLENSGYGGLFWRGPRDFTPVDALPGGVVLTADGEGHEELMGYRGAWLAFTGRHDGNDHESTLLFVENPQNFSFPTRWFVRTSMFAGVCPAPFFDTERVIDGDTTLRLRYDVAIAAGARSIEECAALATSLGGRDLLAPC